MSYLYRFVEPIEEIIEYIGIIYEENRTLKQRVEEHLKKDSWCWNSLFKIEYIECDYSRTDLEHIESHLISLYGTGKYYNRSKSKWGTSTFIPNLEDKWEYYGVINENILFEELEKAKIEAEEAIARKEFYEKILTFMKCQQNQIETYKQLLDNILL